ncbi:hypothetical protein TrVE_jg5203 [Triparma verrucosa]|uniref:UBC core domain-containing protein n=1 Tax=Triparma verrucosa TaxID=1606542 RepID=A0A9W6ZFL7_9STRA|nr:hypothetical protein TrVE_jg5203 [Triparma verrucosa]
MSSRSNIRRIHADVKELAKSPSSMYTAAPLDDDLFVWHFTLRGPPKTEFEGGVYHGQILLPPDYPFKPPNIVFNTPNGRFAVGTKICLSISAYHPEHWQPAWGIRLILEALISFFPTPSEGAIGGLDWKPEERKRLAAESGKWYCPHCGCIGNLIPIVDDDAGGELKLKFAEEIKQLHMHNVTTPPAKSKEEIGKGEGEGEGEGEDEEQVEKGDGDEKAEDPISKPQVSSEQQQQQSPSPKSEEEADPSSPKPWDAPGLTTYARLHLRAGRSIPKKPKLLRVYDFDSPSVQAYATIGVMLFVLLSVWTMKVLEDVEILYLDGSVVLGGVY